MKHSNIHVKIDTSRENVGVEHSLKKFKRLCDAFGVLKEYRKRKEYKKPSVRIKEKTEAAQKRKLKTQLREFRNIKKSKI